MEVKLEAKLGSTKFDNKAWVFSVEDMSCINTSQYIWETPLHSMLLHLPEFQSATLSGYTYIPLTNKSYWNGRFHSQSGGGIQFFYTNLYKYKSDHRNSIIHLVFSTKDEGKALLKFFTEKNYYYKILESSN